MRGLRTQGAAVLITVCLWALMGKSFGSVLVYSICISTMCWLFIDGGRGVVASWTAPKSSDDGSVASRWPGWKWMLAIIVVGGLLGYAVGTEIANRLTGFESPGPFNADSRRRSRSPISSSRAK
jgi:hypothetical protein